MRNVVVSGPPGSGKSTLELNVRRAVAPTAWFLTNLVVSETGHGFLGRVLSAEGHLLFLPGWERETTFYAPVVTAAKWLYVRPPGFHHPKALEFMRSLGDVTEIMLREPVEVVQERRERRSWITRETSQVLTPTVARRHRQLSWATETRVLAQRQAWHALWYEWLEMEDRAPELISMEGLYLTAPHFLTEKHQRRIQQL